MPHDHSHAHGSSHSHVPASATMRALKIGLALTLGFALVEAVGGWLTGSLALISDAGHMATDAAAFIVAMIAQYVARRPPSAKATYGYARAEVLAAFINALSMLALVLWISVEAVERLLAPVPVEGRIVMVIAGIGLAVNMIVAWTLLRAQHSLNARGALLHVFGDILGSVAALASGAVIVFTGWTPIDPILSIVVVVLILRSTVVLLRESAGVLMEHMPTHLSQEAIGAALLRMPGVTGIHDLHVWTMSSERVALTAHLTLVDGEGWPATLSAAQKLLREEFGIDHATLQPSWPQAVHRGKVIPVVPVQEGP